MRKRALVKIPVCKGQYEEQDLWFLAADIPASVRSEFLVLDKNPREKVAFMDGNTCYYLTKNMLIF